MLRGVRLSAQKGRLVADLIRGLPVDQRAQHPRVQPEEGRADHQEGARVGDRQRRAQRRRRHRRAQGQDDLRRQGRRRCKPLHRARQGPRQRASASRPATSSSSSATGNKDIAMGQKIHPTGFRLAVNRNWGSKWFANKQALSAPTLAEDIKVREYLKKKLAHASVGEGHDRAPGEERAHHDPQRASRVSSSARRARTSRRCAATCAR